MATIKCIIKHGYHNFSMQDVADAADVSKGIIHYYFLNKDELMMAVLDRCAVDIEKMMVERITSASDTLQQLRTFITTCFDILRKNKEYYQVNMDFWTQINQKTNVRKAIAKHYETFRHAVKRVINKGIKEGIFKPVDPHMYASYIISVVDGHSLQYLFDEEVFDYDKISASTTELIIDGLLLKGTT